MSVDPLQLKYPHYTPYQYAGNKPVSYIDLDGLEEYMKGVNPDILNEPESDIVKMKGVNPDITNENNSNIDNQPISPKNVSFETPFNKKFVLELVKLSPEYAEKFKSMNNEGKEYHFQSFKHGALTPYGNLQSGFARIDPNNPNRILIFFTTGDSPLAKKDDIGGASKYASLAEETFHVWDYENNKLDLSNPTATDEAEAWKFAATMPGTTMQVPFIDPNQNKTFSDYTIMYIIKNNTVEQIAEWFINGMPSTFNSNGNAYNVINAANQDPKNPTKGLYFNLKLK